MPPCTSFDDRLDVPLAQSRASTIPTRRPRVAASSALPVPTMPPPTTRMSSSFSFSAAIAAARSSGPNFDERETEFDCVIVLPPVPVAGLVGRSDSDVVGRAGGAPGRGSVPAGSAYSVVTHRTGRAGSLLAVGRDHDLDALELLEIGVTGRRHRSTQSAHQIHRAVGNRGRAVQNLFERGDLSDLDAACRGAARCGAPRRPSASRRPGHPSPGRERNRA